MTEETVIAMLEGLLERETTGGLSLTDCGRAALRAMLPAS
jgi:hypothetical protein